MIRLLTIFMLCTSAAVPVAAYSPFDCAAARMSGLATGDTIKDYYARLFERCGCEQNRKIPLCDWLQSQRDAADGQTTGKSTETPSDR